MDYLIHLYRYAAKTTTKKFTFVVVIFYPFIRIESEIGKKSNNPRHLAMNDSQWSELLANDDVEGNQEFKYISGDDKRQV